jgi:hypothetical protein
VRERELGTPSASLLAAPSESVVMLRGHPSIKTRVSDLLGIKSKSGFIQLATTKKEMDRLEELKGRGTLVVQGRVTGTKMVKSFIDASYYFQSTCVLFTPTQILVKG